ncbi:MAG: 16S rRNA (uracil(1498)-N(3))-methyltransferase [Burkholderiaceae bacterium]
MIPRIYLPAPVPVGEALPLAADAAHYLRDVLRLRVGDPVQVFDGVGGRFTSAVHHLDKRAVTLAPATHSGQAAVAPCRLTLVQALATGDKLDWVIEKATETGVQAICLLAAERSTLRLAGERLTRRLEHWRRLAEAACRQCGRDDLPGLSTAPSLAAWLATRAPGPTADSPLLVLDPLATTSLGQWAAGEAAAKPPPRPRDLALLVGPESGLGPAESALAASHGAIAVHLGPRVLRTETAGLVAISILQSRFGDLQ